MHLLCQLRLCVILAEEPSTTTNERKFRFINTFWDTPTAYREYRLISPRLAPKQQVLQQAIGQAAAFTVEPQNSMQIHTVLQKVTLELRLISEQQRGVAGAIAA